MRFVIILIKFLCMYVCMYALHYITDCDNGYLWSLVTDDDVAHCCWCWWSWSAADEVVDINWTLTARPGTTALLLAADWAWSSPGHSRITALRTPWRNDDPAPDPGDHDDEVALRPEAQSTPPPPRSNVIDVTWSVTSLRRALQTQHRCFAAAGPKPSNWTATSWH